MANRYPANPQYGPIHLREDGKTMELEDGTKIEGAHPWIRRRLAEMRHGWKDPAYGRSSQISREFLKKAVK